MRVIEPEGISYFADRVLFAQQEGFGFIYNEVVDMIFCMLPSFFL